LENTRRTFFKASTSAFLVATNLAHCFPADIAHERYEISPPLQVLEQRPNRIQILAIEVLKQLF